MQPGYPGSGQDPYGQQPPYSDPYAQPQYPPQQPPPAPPYGQQPQQPPPYQDPYGQPQQPPPYQDPYAQPQQPAYQDPYGQPTSGSPYPTSGPGYPGLGQYPVAGYGAPMGGPQQNNTLGLISMILGIIAIPAACCAFLGMIVGVGALVLGILGMRKAAAGQASNRGQALAGVICGSIGLVLSIGSAIAGAALNLSHLPSS
jgi:hypothetical protein